MTVLDYDGGRADSYTELYSIDEQSTEFGDIVNAVEEKDIVWMGSIAWALFHKAHDFLK